MTAAEFEHQWKEKKTNKKADFIHLIQVAARFRPSVVFIQSMCFENDLLGLNAQMLYYVKDPEATVSFFRSLLDKNGKLLIILVSSKKMKTLFLSLIFLQKHWL